MIASRINRRRGFTLIEILVAVGAMALIAVGLASIFQTIGRTVSGGRRLNLLNARVALIEHQMRLDFASMTRDGFLAIRNQTTNTAGTGATALNVALNAEGAASRPRRIDEIVFFAKGQFESARDPLHPAYVATANAARIYYGHGLRQFPTSPEYRQPEPTNVNVNATRLGFNGANRFAGDWTLLRHVTLLSTVETARQPLVPALGLDPVNNPAHRLRMTDKYGQIALQPAALNIFRHLLGIYPSPQPGSPTPITQNTQVIRTGYPMFASGIVDIATQSLSDIKLIITTARVDPVAVNPTSWDANQGPDGVGGPLYTPGKPALDRQKLWMDSAFPTQSDQVRGGETLKIGNFQIPGVPPGQRIRFEAGPTDYLSVLNNKNTKGGSFAGGKLEQAYRRADQLMLSSSNFLQGCTEFIVEWSFGDVDSNTNQVIWHGLERGIDTNPTLAGFEASAARPYPYDSSGTFGSTGASTPITNKGYIKLDGSIETAGYQVPASLINHADPVPPTAVVLTSYFGFLDPTRTDGAPWPWPTLIRVTVRMLDPGDASAEQTFQFVFDAPGNAAYAPAEYELKTREQPSGKAL